MKDLAMAGRLGEQQISRLLRCSIRGHSHDGDFSCNPRSGSRQMPLPRRETTWNQCCACSSSNIFTAGVKIGIPKFTQMGECSERLFSSYSFLIGNWWCGSLGQCSEVGIWNMVVFWNWAIVILLLLNAVILKRIWQDVFDCLFIPLCEDKFVVYFHVYFCMSHPIWKNVLDYVVKRNEGI